MVSVLTPPYWSIQRATWWQRRASCTFLSPKGILRTIISPKDQANHPTLHSVPIGNAAINIGLPTCWDEWFPEVARSYGLRGADILSYPTAIGSEPDHPNFNTRPLWQKVITGHAIANGLFIAVPNRTGTEGLISFYGGSFIVDPFGRMLVEAPEDEEVAMVAEIDIAQRQDWLQLFPFLVHDAPIPTAH